VRNRIFFKLLAAFLVVIVAAAVTFDRDAGRRMASFSAQRNRAQPHPEERSSSLTASKPTEVTPSPTLPRRKANPPALASPSSIPRAKSWPIPSQIPPAWKTILRVRNSSLRSKAKSAAMNARSATLGIPFLYIAVPVSGGAVRLAYPLSDVEAVSAQVRRRLELASGITFLFALIVAAAASQ